ncbi:MAG: Protein-arginine kinase [Firmicutes bacterium]|nr:Protein-arginine kinase [Bacillota bacterium]
MSKWAKWTESEGPLSPSVVSTRVRLARNFTGLPFPGTMRTEQALEVVARIRGIIGASGKQIGLPGFRLFPMAELPPVDRLALVESHLISPDLANKHEGAVALTEDQSVAIMVNEEDHVRIQCLLAGFQLDEAWRLASQVDDWLDGEGNFSFHEEYGYLTTCPTNVGTGLRASVMLHLPILAMTNQIEKVIATIGQLGLMARGLYGEGTQAAGHMFQISNQVTLGFSEEELIRNLKAVVEQIVTQERLLTRNVLAQDRMRILDRVHRSIGLMLGARVLDSKEAMSLLSDIRLGVSAELIKLPQHVLTELMVLAKPHVLQTECGQTLDAFGRDVKRAEFLRERLQNALQSNR